MLEKIKAYRARRKHFRTLMRRQAWYDKRSPHLFGYDLTYTPFDLRDIRAAVQDETKFRWWKDNYWTDEQWAKSGLRVMEDTSINISYFKSPTGYLWKNYKGEVHRAYNILLHNGVPQFQNFVEEEDRMRISKEIEDSKSE